MPRYHALSLIDHFQGGRFVDQFGADFDFHAVFPFQPRFVHMADPVLPLVRLRDGLVQPLAPPPHGMALADRFHHAGRLFFADDPQKHPARDFGSTTGMLTEA